MHTQGSDEIDIHKYKKGKRINKGTFGVVYNAEEKETGKLFAAKIIDCGDDEKQCDKMIDREVKILICAQHPAIIKLIGYSKIDFHDEYNVTIIMELAKNGSFADLLKNIQEGNIPIEYTNTSRQIIIAGVACGMKYLHDNNIIHRDLKSGNILLDENFYPHITDFGMSKIYEIGHSYSQSQFGGTLAYEAPEIFRNEPYNKKVDVYAFGILMYEVLTDSVPYPLLVSGKIPDYDFRWKVVNENYRPQFDAPIKKSFHELIEKCWSADPQERPTFDEIFDKLVCFELEDDDMEFIIDGVDIEQFNSYIRSILNINESINHLLDKIKTIKTENKEIKAENMKLKKQNKQQNDQLNSIKNENQELKAEIMKMKNKMIPKVGELCLKDIRPIDICFVVDATSSMQYLSFFTYDLINDISLDVTYNNRRADIRFGGVVLRDPIDYKEPPDFIIPEETEFDKMTRLKYLEIAKQMPEDTEDRKEYKKRRIEELTCELGKIIENTFKINLKVWDDKKKK